MCGKDVFVYCPICKKNKYINLGGVTLVSYKNKIYDLIRCSDCKKSFISITSGSYGNTLNNFIRRVENHTNIPILSKLEDKIYSSNYNEKTPEDKIETDLFTYAKELFGEELLHKYEYEIKYIIQWLMANTFNVPNINLVSYAYEDIKDECKIVGAACY